MLRILSALLFALSSSWSSIAAAYAFPDAGCGDRPVVVVSNTTSLSGYGNSPNPAASPSAFQAAMDAGAASIDGTYNSQVGTLHVGPTVAQPGTAAYPTGVTYVLSTDMKNDNGAVIQTLTSSITLACRVAQCDDDVDNDGDTLIDTDDPGCTSADDDDEVQLCTHPAGENLGFARSAAPNVACVEQCASDKVLTFSVTADGGAADSAHEWISTGAECPATADESSEGTTKTLGGTYTVQAGNPFAALIEGWQQTYEAVAAVYRKSYAITPTSVAQTSDSDAPRPDTGDATSITYVMAGGTTIYNYRNLLPTVVTTVTTPVSTTTRADGSSSSTPGPVTTSTTTSSTTPTNTTRTTTSSTTNGDGSTTTTVTTYTTTVNNVTNYVLNNSGGPGGRGGTNPAPAPNTGSGGGGGGGGGGGDGSGQGDGEGEGGGCDLTANEKCGVGNATFPDLGEVPTIDESLTTFWQSFQSTPLGNAALTFGDGIPTGSLSCSAPSFELWGETFTFNAYCDLLVPFSPMIRNCALLAWALFSLVLLLKA